MFQTSVPIWRRPSAWAVACAAALAAALVVVVWGAAKYRSQVTPIAVRLGMPLQVPSGLLFIASHEDYWAAEGLEVQARAYESGKVAMQALLAGEVDAATMAGAPLAIAAFSDSRFVSMASIGAMHDEPRIVARSDRGIEQPADLAGKRVATQRGSEVHFFLHRFLIHHGVAEQDVTLVFMEPRQMPEALAAGEIDAFAMREPFISQAQDRLGNDVVVFAESGLLLRPEYLVVSRDFLQQHPQAAERMLRALVRAERFARRRPQTARRIIMAAAMNFQEDAVQPAWHTLVLDVHLDQWLLSDLDHQAQWAIHAGLADPQSMPNYLDFLQLEPLEAVKPHAVTIIR